MCHTGYCRCLRALPDIVGAFEPYRTLSKPLCRIGCCSSLCDLSVNVGALVPYRLIANALYLIGLVKFYGLIWIKYKRSCTYVWGLCFSNVMLTHWVFNLLFSCFLYRYRLARTLNYPTKIAHVCPMVSTVHFWHEVVVWWRIRVLSSRGVLCCFFCHV